MSDLASARALEALLARIYVDEKARAAFLADPLAECRRAGIAEEDCLLLVERLDEQGLALAAESFSRKRNRRARHK